jgi:hypothetical protein
LARVLTFTEFVEYLFVRLYDLDTGKGEFIDIRQVAAELQEPIADTWPFEAAEYFDQVGRRRPVLAKAR